MIPLVMTGEPYEHVSKTVTGADRACTMLQTNKGPLTVAECSRLLQVVPGTLRSRIRRLGWDHPDVVQVGELTPFKAGTAENKKRADELTAGELKRLGTKSRPEKLNSIRELGTWEREYYDPRTDESHNERHYRR